MGCWESCNPNYKSLSNPNGINLIEEGKGNWVKRTFGKVEIHIKLDFEIFKDDNKKKTQKFADEVIFCVPGVKLSEVISKFISTTKKAKSEEYDKLWREWTLDPSKTSIVVSLTNKDAQFTENKYKSLNQLKLTVESGARYFVQVTAWWYKISSDSEFTMTRRSLVNMTLSTGLSSIKTVSTESPRNSFNNEKIVFESTKPKKSKKKSRKKSKSKSKAKSKKKKLNGINIHKSKTNKNK